MEFTTLQIGIEKNVARVALNRPEVRNALNALMIRELTEAIDWLDAREDIHVIEICGNGKSFCAGADLNYMKDIAKYGYAQNLDDANKLSKLFKTIYFCNTPVIALVHGVQTCALPICIIDPVDTRRILAMGIAASLNQKFPPQQFGVFRM